MKKRMRRLVAMLLATAMVVQQGSTLGVLAVETEPMSESFTEAMSISQEPGTEAGEKIEETQVPETKAEETKAPEIQAPETKVEETKAPETKAEEAKTAENGAEETEPTTQKAQTQETAGETLTESEQTTETVTEQVTEAQSEPTTEAVAEEATEAASETVAEAETEKESETEETVVLETSVMQEVFQKTVEDATVPMVKYTVKVANKAEKTAAEGVSLKVVLADELSYKKEVGETPELVSFETLGKAIEASAFENELTEADKTAYANGGVVLWKDQTIAAGEEKAFVFCAEVTDGQTDVNALKNLWFVDGEAVAAEKIRWANTDLLEVKEELPTEFIVENGDMVVTATLSEGTVLPEGAKFVVVKKELTEEEKALVEEQLGENAVSYGYVAYDMHFEVDGQEVEPENGEVSVSVQYKNAVQLTTEEVPEQETEAAGTMSDAIEFAAPETKTETSATEYKILHLAENAGGNVVAEDVTDTVNVAADGDVTGAGFTTDSFSTVVLLGLDEVVEIIDRSFSLSAEVKIEGQGFELKENQFAFTLTETNQGGSPAGWPQNITEASNDKDGNISFENVSLSERPEWAAQQEEYNYYYVLKQKSSAWAGITCDSCEYMVTITETKAENGSLQLTGKCELFKGAEGEGAQADKPQFVNQYKEITFGSEYGYTIENLLRGYNVISMNNATIANHTVGAIMVGGNLYVNDDLQPGGNLNQGDITTKPSYVKGKVECSWNYASANHGTILPAYVGSANKVEYNESGSAILLNGQNFTDDISKKKLYVSDTYVDFETVKGVLDAASEYFQKNAETELIYPEGSTLHIPSGRNVTIGSMEGVTEVVIDGDISSMENTVINILDTGTVDLPHLMVGGHDADSTVEDGVGSSIVWNIPNASTVNVGVGGRGWAGHILAQNAYVEKKGSQYAGTLVGNTVYVSGEGHSWPYNGSVLVPTKGMFTAKKTVNGNTPEDGVTFTFKMEEISFPPEIDVSTFGDEGTVGIRTRNNEGDKVDFGSVDYKEPGIYFYIISEVAPKEENPHFIYDKQQYLVVVRVTKNKEEDKLESKINYYPIIEALAYNNNREKIREKEANGVRANYIVNGVCYYVSEKKTEASFDNKELGSLKVTKSFAGDSALSKEEKNAIVFTVEGPNDYSITFTYADMPDGSKTLENLVPGTYTVTESKAGKDGYSLSTTYNVGDDGTVSVVAGDTPTELIITNTYTQKKGSLTVTKTFEGDLKATDLTAAQKAAIKFEITGPDGYTNSLTYADVEAGKNTVENLVPGEYTVTEKNGNVDGYERVTTYSVGMDGKVEVTAETSVTVEVTNTYTVEKTSKSVEKVWVDEDDKDDLRPKSIQVQLFAGGVAYGAPVELNEGNNWSCKWEDLPKKDAGKDVVYTVKEVGTVTGYTTAYATDEATGKVTITNTHTKETTSKEVKKEWSAPEWKLKDLPESVTVMLYQNGEQYGAAVTLTAEEGWKHKWENLPKYDENGKLYEYTVDEEDVEGFIKKVEGTTITNTFDNDTELEVEKVWVAPEWKMKDLPESVTVKLYQNGEQYEAAIKLAAEEGWKHKWENLPKYDATGKLYEYTVDEEEVEGFTKKIEGTTITNTFDNNTELEVEKVWVAPEWKMKVLPESVTVKLYQNGEQYEAAIKLTVADGWKHKWENLPKYDATGKLYEYTVDEEEVEGFIKKIEGTTITNTFDNNTELEVEKVWVGDAEDTRPEFIEVQLLADGETYGEKVALNKENSWSYTWTELPKANADGKDIEYTVEEISNVPGYTTAYATDAQTGKVTITNTITSVKVSKVDVTTGAELEGAHIQILDKDGNVVEEWDSTKEAHEVKGLKTGETYTLKETVAPDGYTLTAETTFTLKEDGTVDSGKTTTNTKDGVLLVEDSFNKVSILKVDESGEALKGAKLVIKDKDGKAVGEPWTTDGKTHDITGLAKGNYTLSEIEAPKGYQVSADVPFEITGKEAAGQTIEVKMTDEKIPESATYSLTVTKNLRLDGITSDIGIRDAVFYVALFSDEAKTQRVSSVKQIVFKNQISSSVTFDNLSVGTYYVGETDENGTLLVSKMVNDRIIFYPEYTGEGKVLLEGDEKNAIADFTNVYVEFTDDLYLSGQLKITKKILINGEEGTSDATYYAGVFNSPDMSEPLEIVPLELGGGSSTSYTVTNLPIGDTIGSSMTYYVTETDENGVPLDPEEVTEFEVSVDKSEIILDANNSRQEVVITNSFTEEETETETEVPKKEAPKTGDDTDFMRYLLMMALSAGVCAAAFEEKRRKARRVRK